VTVAGGGTSFLTLSGTLPALNAALDGLHYARTAGATSDFLSVLVSDGTRSGGTGVALALGLDSDPFNIITLPAAQSIGAGTVLVFSESNGNAIQVADGDSNGATEVLALEVANGRLAVGNTAGLAYFSGNGTHLLSMTGTLKALNAALDGLEYAPAPGASSDFLSVEFLNIAAATTAGLPITVTA
jgi:hypothetical protein